MTFISQWGNLRVPTHPGGTFTKPFYVGTNKDVGYYLYHLNSDIVISKTLGFSYESSGTIFNPIWKWLNGYCYFQSSNNNYIWYSTIYNSWVITSTLPGKPPIETWTWYDETETTGSYTGDTFYSGILPSLEATSNFIARGSLRGSVENEYNGTPVQVTTSYKYYKRENEESNICGIYKDQSEDENPDITIGLPKFKDQKTGTYTRSLYKKDDNYTYDTISYNDTVHKWIIGSYNDTSGWYEGIEPSVDASVLFKFTVPEGSTVTGTNLTITFDKYVIGDNTLDSYGFSIGKWHV